MTATESVTTESLTAETVGREGITPPVLTRLKSDYGYEPVPTDIYWRPEIWAKEREAIFRKSWHLIGRSELVPEPTSFYVHYNHTFNVPILICRDEEGTLQAFYNICRHRGTMVEERCAGQTGSFTCRFHGWRYGLDGKLLSVRDSKGFPELNRADFPLDRVNIDEWNGFLFVNLEDEPSKSLEEYLGRLAADLEGFPFDDMSAVPFRYEMKLRCNWKLVMDSFSEGYHLPTLHSQSIGGEPMAGKKNPFGRMIDVRIKGPHRALSVMGNDEARPGPVQVIGYTNAPGPSVTGAPADQTLELPKGVNETRHPEWVSDMQIFFPNFIIGMSSGMYFIHQVWPLSENESLFQMHGWMRAARNAAERLGQENALVELRQVVMAEDANTMERSQRALESGHFKEMPLHDHELALRHQYHTVVNILNEYDASRGQSS